MKMHDDLRERLSRSVEPLRPVDPPLDRIRRRGRVRALRRRSGAAVAGVIAAAAIVAPLWGLRSVGTTRDVSLANHASRSALEVVVSSPEDVLANGVCTLWQPDAYVGFQLTSDGSGPVEICSQMWLSGNPSGSSFSSQHEGFSFQPHDSAPSMIACAEPGSVSVFFTSVHPTCDDAGMVPVPDGYREPLARWEQTFATIKLTLTGGVGNCIDGPTAVQTWRSALDANGFESWTINDEWRTKADAPCSWFHVAYPDQRIDIVNDVSS
jgi:hypothetical protein